VRRVVANVVRHALGALALCAVVASAAAQELANGIFLVAAPGMRDPNFSETVVLVTQPPRGGPFGVIVNRPLGRRLSEMIGEGAQIPPAADMLYRGGPVERTRLLALVRAAEAPGGSFRVREDVFLVLDPQVIETVLSGELVVRDYRIYAGYSGWGDGQLQVELAEGGWFVAPAGAEAIFSRDPATLWRELTRELAGERT
jgi:putative transcriptional regulator